MLKRAGFLIFFLALTANADDGFVIIGDSGKDNSTQANVAQAMLDYCQENYCDLGMLAGDVVYPNGVSSENDPILETMFDKYYNPLEIPFLITLGNHDYGWLTNDWVRGDYNLRHAQRNPLFVLPHFWYIHETAESVIAVIDTNRLFWHKQEAPMKRLLKKAYQMAKDSGRWFFVMGHHPYLSNGKHGNAGRYDGVPTLGFNIKRIIENYVCGKADMYIAGHEHLLQVFDGNVAGCDLPLVVSGSAATATEILRDTPALYQSETEGYFHMLVSPDKAVLKTLDRKNNVLFEKEYFKRPKL